MIYHDKYIATPPGATLEEQLIDRGIGFPEFAIKLGVSMDQLDDLIEGNILLSEKLAERLEVLLDIPARYWLNLEFIFREKLRLIEREKEISRSDFPVAAL